MKAAGGAADQPGGRRWWWCWLCGPAHDQSTVAPLFAGKAASRQCWSACKEYKTSRPWCGRRGWQCSEPGHGGRPWRVGSSGWALLVFRRFSGHSDRGGDIGDGDPWGVRRQNTSVWRQGERFLRMTPRFKVNSRGGWSGEL